MIWQMMAMLHSGRRAAKDNEGWKGIKDVKICSTVENN